MNSTNALGLPEQSEMPAIVVVGSMMIDQITYCGRVPDEGETLVADRYEQGFGGKGANQAVMAARLGAAVSFIGCVGDDDLGRATVANLEAHGIDASAVATIAGCATGVAPIWVDGRGANRILIARGANDAVDADAVAEGLGGRDGVAVVLAQLETPQAASVEAFRLARQGGAVTILNPAPAATLDGQLLDVTDWLIPNESEYELLFGRPPDPEDIAAESAGRPYAVGGHPRRRRSDRQPRRDDLGGRRALRPGRRHHWRRRRLRRRLRHGGSRRTRSRRRRSSRMRGRLAGGAWSRDAAFVSLASRRGGRAQHHQQGGKMNHQSKTIDRRRLLRMSALGGAGLIVGPTIASALGVTRVAASGTTAPGELDEFNVQLGWIANVENAGEFVAASKGFYADEGINPTLTPGGPGAILEPTVVSGAALVGLSSADTIALANAEGAGLKIVGVTLQQNPSAVMSLASNPVPDAQSLEGKRLGLQQTADAIYEAFFLKAGVDASQVTIVPVQFDPAPLVAGEVDAFASFQTNQPIALAAQGIETVSWLLADYGYNLYADAFFVTEDTLADEEARDMVVRFLRATRRGWEDAIADPAAAAQIVVDEYGAELDLDLEGQTATLDAFVPLIQTEEIAEQGLFWMTDEGIAANVETMQSVDIEVDESLFTNELLEEI